MQKNLIIAIALLVLVITISPFSFAKEKESKLEQFKEEVTTEAKKTHPQHPHNGKKEGDRSFCEWLFEELFWEPIFHPRHSMIGRGFVNLVTYPYVGPYRNIELAARENNDDQNLKVTAGITRQYVSDNDLNVETSAWRIDTSLIYDRLSFDLAQTKYDNDFGEELNFNQILLSYIFAKNNYWQFKTGIGWEEIAGVNGFRYQYVVDYQRDELIWDLSLGLTRLTTAKTVFEIAPGIGYSEDFFAVKLGYRFKAIRNDTLFGPELTAEVKF